MKRKRRNTPPPCFIFTPELLALTQEAVKHFARAVERRMSWPGGDQPAKIVFAGETLQQVNRKLEAMRTSVGVICLTTFDYNEKIVIAAAIQLSMFDLLALPSSPQREKGLKRCQRVLQFALDTGRSPKQ